MGSPQIVLASASPRRTDLLAMLGITADVVPADLDEARQPGESAAAMVIRLAEAKATHVAANLPTSDEDVFVLAGDTTVLVNGEVLGKPVDEADARRMLGLLGGAQHHVASGIAIWSAGRLESAVDMTTVWMRSLDDADIDWYLATGEHRGKAGAYGIQGAAARFVGRIEGDHSGVVGLPLAAVDRLFARFGRSLGEFS